MAMKLGKGDKLQGWKRQQESATYLATATTFGGSFTGAAITSWLAMARVSLIRSYSVGFSTAGSPTVPLFYTFFYFCYISK